jgi:hypothetical protein
VFLRSNRARVLAALAVVVLCGIFVPPLVTLNRFKARVSGSISAALGRHTTVGDIRLRLVPQPGLDLTNFVVDDDPAFSAEPMLRADEVTAYLRLASLWQGRFEIAQLSLKNPSLNLVRNAQGDWNIEALLARATQVPTAPTTKRRPEARPRFPYIEAEEGRINLKLGNEKKAYALSEADFALWLASEDEWRMRLEARPIRTDANLSDTGTLRVEGSLVRAAALRDTALRFDYEWERAQLGNLTQLVWGRDRGWRGALTLNGSVAGTPHDLLLSARVRVADFRRYDILAGDEFNADLRCSARYLGDTQTLSAIDCRLPAGSGEVAARGMVTGVLSDRRWELSVAATAVPVSEVVRFARHAKKDMGSLYAAGSLDAAFTYRVLGGQHVWSGGGATSLVRFTGRPLATPFEVAPIRFSLGPVPDPLFQPERRPDSPFQPRLRPRLDAAGPPMISRLVIQPMSVSLGGALPATIDARFDREGYSIGLHGDSEIARATSIAAAFGFRPPQTGASGGARLDLALTGDWQGFAPPLATGSALLRNVTAEIKGVNAPVRIAGGLLAFSAAGVDALNLNAAFPAAGITLQGDLHLPRGCSTLLNCPLRFALTSPALSLDDLNRLLNPRFHPQSWYRFIVGSTPTTGLRRLQAEGTLSTPRLAVKSVTVNRFSCALRLAGGKLLVREATGELFGGKHSGEWSADFSGNTPVYEGAGSLDRADVAQLSTAMRDSWGAGLASADYKFSASGDTAAELAASALGELRFDWRNGMLRHLGLRGEPPLRLRRFAGMLRLREARLTFDAGRLETAEGIYSVSGSSTLARTLDLKLEGPTHTYLVTGTLERPRVSAPPATEAVLQQ